MLIDKNKAEPIDTAQLLTKESNMKQLVVSDKGQSKVPTGHLKHQPLPRPPNPPPPPGDKPTSEIFSPRNLCTLLSRSPFGSCTTTTAAGRQQLIFEPRANNRRQSPRPEWVSRRSRIVRRTDAFSFSTTEYVFVLYLAQQNTYLCCIWHNGISWIPVVFITQRTTELAIFVPLDHVNITLSQDLGI